MRDGHPPHPELIKARIRIEHGTIAEFERAAGLSKDSVRQVFRGRSVRRTADALADLMGMSTQALFPGRFLMKRDDISRKRETHRLNEVAR